MSSTSPDVEAGPAPAAPAAPRAPGGPAPRGRLNGSKSPASGGVEPAEARVGLPQPTTCAVNYILRRDSGRDFVAELTLTNTGDRELRDWMMSFTFPGRQTVTKAQPAVRQQGRAVQVQAPATDPALAPGASRKVSLTGSYTGDNLLPVEFKVGDSDCGVRVSGVAGSAPTTAAATRTPTTAAPKPAARTNAAKSGDSRGKPAKPAKPAKAGKHGKGGK